MGVSDSRIPSWPGSEAEPAALAGLIEALSESDGPADEAGEWPEPLWQRLTEVGAPRWSISADEGGQSCDRATLLRRYAMIAEGSLTAAFILTQHDAAVRRLAAGDTTRAKEWLRAIAAGRAFATVGISQLTTSTRRGARALLATIEPGGGVRLDGAMPWVTAAQRADVIVTGALTEDDRQVLIALPTRSTGLTVQPPFRLAAVQASCTSEVTCEGVVAGAEDVLAGPAHDLGSRPGMAGTGGLETSALALGLARAALVGLSAESSARDELSEPFEALAASWETLAERLLAAADGRTDAPPAATLRGQANSLVLRLTQTYLTARKGSGFVRPEPAQRWARQALFFLVWSCPTPVAHSTVRDLAGICPA